MDVGMLWFDNDKERDLSAKVIRAADYYRKKYGNVPNLCYVNPNMLSPVKAGEKRESIKAGDIEIKPAWTVLPHHFWIGIQA